MRGRIPGIRRLFRLDVLRPPVERDVDDELAFHFDCAVAELERRGLAPGAAHAEAERRFGDVRRYRGELRAIADGRAADLRRSNHLESLMDDLRHALRGMRRSPGFALAVVLTLALGIGANATMFGLVDRLILRPPAHVVAPEQLREIGRVATFDGDTRVLTAAAYPAIADFGASVPALAHVAGYAHREMSVGRGAAAEPVQAGVVTGEFFAMLGTRPTLGRLLQPSDDRRDAGEPAVVLGHGFWQRRLGGDPGVVGRTLRLDRGVYTVVGVAPDGFSGLRRAPVDVWLPFVPVYVASGQPEMIDGYDWLTLTAVGRLRPGVAEGAATAQVTLAQRAIALEDDGSDTATVGALVPVLPSASVDENTDAKVALLLGGVSLLVLLIACANVANLLLARALRRRREVAVRLALGVSRRRLVLQLLTESLVLAALGGAAALLVVHWGGELLRALLYADAAWEGSPVDGRVLLFTALVTLATGLLAGLLPALQTSRPSLTSALKLGARDGGGRQSRTRAALLVTQAALSVVLLVGTGLFTRSLTAAANERIGYDVHDVLVGSMNVRGVGYDGARTDALYRDVAERVRALPGIAGVGVAAALPLRSVYAVGQFVVPGRDTLPQPDGGGPYVNAVSAGFLDAVGMRVLHGRGFTEEDRAGSQRVMIVNQAMADLYWPGGDALGQCVKLVADSVPCATIVGIVENARRTSLLESAHHQYMVPIGQHDPFMDRRTLFVRPAPGADHAAVAARVRDAMQSAAPDLPFADVYVMADLLDGEMRPWRMGAALFGAFGALALVLAAVGLYGVIAYSVSQRTHELGVRMALGAQQAQVRTLVLRQGVLLAAIGALVGAALAWLLAPRVADLLYETSPRDPAIFAIVALTLLVVAALATLVPAWRASRVDPAVALRAE